jgi:thiol-disulfide isomerase/thioredoxin
MKIALLTIFRVLNYGAILQAFALSRILSQYGKVELLDYDNPNLRSLRLLRFAPSRKGLGRLLKDLIRIVPRWGAIRSFNYFIAENLTVSKSYESKELTGELSKTYDLLVAGSDQVWNPNCVSGNKQVDPVYFFEFADPEVSRISYASSMGPCRLTDVQLDEVCGYLGRFSAVSVREVLASSVLERKMVSEVKVVLDPTLLLTADEWKEQFPRDSNRTTGAPYLLVYSVRNSRLLKDVAAHFSEKLGIKTIVIDQEIYPVARADRHVGDCGPVEFLEYVSNAAFVVTDSFHGVCFSILFERDFVAVSSERISNLLKLLGLDNREISWKEDLESVALETSFIESGRVLDRLRQESREFLRVAIEKACDQTQPRGMD